MKNNLVFTALAAGLLLSACSKKDETPASSAKKTPVSVTKPDFSKYALMGLDSPFLRIDSANKMIGSYLESRENSDDLKALIVDADALRYYLQNPNIKYFKLMFAHKMSYINSGHQGVPTGMDHEGLTIVIAGFGADNNYIYSDQGAVMDFCQPCPYTCPESGSAQYDMLPNYTNYSGL